jgi:hypothetical protein
VIVRVEHVEATGREAVVAGDGTPLATSFTVTATVEVRDVESMGEAVRRIELLLTDAPDRPATSHAHVHDWVSVPPLQRMLCRCGESRRTP